MSNTNPIRAPRRFTDETGRPCVRVPLANTPLSAALLAEDFDRLTGDGLSCNWGLNHNRKGGQAYVCVSVKGANTVNVARFVTGARWKQAVRYRTPDRLDLRPENLHVTKGGKAHKDCAALLEQEETTGVVE